VSRLLTLPQIRQHHKVSLLPCKGTSAISAFLFINNCYASPVFANDPSPSTEASVGFTESQNHRMVGVGRDLCGSSSPTPLPKQGHLQQAAQDLVQVGLLPFPLVTRPALSLFPFLTCNLCVLCQSIRYLPILLEDSQRLEEMTSFRKQ